MKIFQKKKKKEEKSSICTEDKIGTYITDKM